MRSGNFANWVSSLIRTSVSDTSHYEYRNVIQNAGDAEPARFEIRSRSIN